MITKKIKHKDSAGIVHEYDIGAEAANITEDAKHQFVSDDEKKSWGGKMDPAGDASGATVKFQQAASRANIFTGEKLSVIFGKIAKWFSDLKGHTFLDLIQNATTADTTRAVSAAVAKNLQDQITNKANANHTHPLSSITGRSGYKILAVQEVLVTCPSVDPNKGGSGTSYFNAISGATVYYAVLKSAGWLNVTGAQITGNSILATFINTGSGAHSGSASFLIFAVAPL